MVAELALSTNTPIDQNSPQLAKKIIVSGVLATKQHTLWLNNLYLISLRRIYCLVAKTPLTIFFANVRLFWYNSANKNTITSCFLPDTITEILLKVALNTKNQIKSN